MIAINHNPGRINITMKTIIITGSNSGIGKEAALILAKQGHRILMLCRDSKKSRLVQKELIKQTDNQNVLLFTADLADPVSIILVLDKIKSQFPVIDVLINNAGVYKVNREENSMGVEMTLAVNFLAPYMLSKMLLPNLRASNNARIINVVSELYKSGSIDLQDLMMQKKYKAGNAYANSKLASILLTAGLAKKYEKYEISVNALHPGVLATNSFREYPKFFIKILNSFLEKPQYGGERIATMAVSDEFENVSGIYCYKDEKRDMSIPEEEYNKTEQLLQVAEKLTDVKV